MKNYNLNLLGLDIAFRADVDEQRVEQARQMIEERFEKLRARGERSSKELLMTFLVLGLADDLLQSNEQIAEMNKRTTQLLKKIDELTNI